MYVSFTSELAFMATLLREIKSCRSREPTEVQGKTGGLVWTQVPSSNTVRIIKRFYLNCMRVLARSA
jgi:hypothetical protein